MDNIEYIKDNRVDSMNTKPFQSHTPLNPMPYIENIPNASMQNTNFRTTLWTGCYAQMTLMCIPPCSDIGIEIHNDTDQIIRIEQGMALVKTGACENLLNNQKKACVGDTIFIPAGTWHNIINVQHTPLKLSSIYAPPKHPVGTIHRTKEDSEKEHY